MNRTRYRALAMAVALVVMVGLSGSYLVRAQEATPVGTPIAAEADELITRGQEIYANVCASCHMVDGRGVEGIYPALAGNVIVTLDDPYVLAHTVLWGRGGMPRFNGVYDDQEIAAVLSYVRSELEGNDAAPVSAEFVGQVRADYEARGQAPAAATPEMDSATPETGQEPSDEVEEADPSEED